MKFLFDIFEGMPRGLILSISVVMTAMAGFIDLVIGPEVSSAIFYALPIGVASWYGNRGLGMIISTLAAIVWLVTDNISGSEAAQMALAKIRQNVLQKMTEVGWPVTLSIGLVSYEAAPANVKEMITLADSVMYSVKRRGKDGFRHIRWDGKRDGI